MATWLQKYIFDISSPSTFMYLWADNIFQNNHWFLTWFCNILRVKTPVICQTVVGIDNIKCVSSWFPFQQGIMNNLDCQLFHIYLMAKIYMYICVSWLLYIYVCVCVYTTCLLSIRNRLPVPEHGNQQQQTYTNCAQIRKIGRMWPKPNQFWISGHSFHVFSWNCP